MADLGTLVPASPLDASDNNRLTFTNDLDLATASRTLGDTPADFGTMDTLLWTVEYQLSLTVLGDDSYGLEIRIMNGTTVLAAADSGGAWAAVDLNVNNVLDETLGPTAFAFVNTTANKATWDGASVELRQRYTQNMAKDGAHVAVDHVQITGTYTAAASDLVVQDATHSHAADSPSLTQVHELTVADSGHAHTAESPSLTQVHELVVAEGTHGHTADNLTMTVSVELTVGDASHAHTADNPSLTQVHELAVGDAAHGHTADSPTLTQAHSLTVADASHGHTADNLTLTTDSAPTLDVANGAHAHTADTFGLTQTHELAVADASHAHTADSPTLGVTADLTVADAAHGHTVENLTLVQVHVLLVADTAHGHAGDGVTLEQVHLLVSADGTHAHMADGVTLSGPAEADPYPLSVVLTEPPHRVAAKTATKTKHREPAAGLKHKES